MKKILLLLVGVFCFWSLSGPDVIKAESTASAELVRVDYNLPYPGILADNPLYFLKVFRDKVVLFALRDQTQKGFYLLLMSDKRLAGAKRLAEEKKMDLAAATLTQAEGFFQQAVDLAVGQKDGGKSEDLLVKLAASSAKHGEVIQAIVAKINLPQVQISLAESQKSRDKLAEVLLKVPRIGKED